MLDQFKRLGKHSIVYGLSNALSASISLVLLPILTRHLTPGQYGALDLGIVFAAQLGIILQLGIGSAVFKFVLQGSSDPRGRGNVLATAYYTVAAFATAVTLCLLLFSDRLATMLIGNVAYTGLVAAILLKGCFEAIAVVPMARLRMREESVTYGALMVGRLLFSVVVFYIILAVFHAGLPALIMALGVESAVFALVASATAWGDLNKGYSLKVMKRMLAFGLPLVPFAFGLTALGLADRYFLRYFTSLDEVGRYTVGYKLAAGLGVAIRAFQVAWPTVLFSAAERPDAGRLYSRLLTYLLFFLGLAGLVVSVFGRELMALLVGPAFRSAYIVVPILVLAQIALGVFYVTAVGSNLTGKTHYQTMAVAIALVVFVSLSVLLVPALGMLGAAIATACGYAVLAGTSCALSLRLYPVRYEWGRVSILLGLAATLTLIGLSISTGSTAVDVLLKIVVVALYPALLYLLGVLNVSERQILHTALGSFFRRDFTAPGMRSH